MSLFQESAMGRLIRIATPTKLFVYHEEQPDFKIPCDDAETNEDEKGLEPITNTSNHEAILGAIVYEDPMELSQTSTFRAIGGAASH
jgi:hypothetical protein